MKAISLLVLLSFATVMVFAAGVQTYVDDLTLTVTTDTGVDSTTHEETWRIGLVEDGVTSIMGQVKISGPSSTANGQGDLDSGYVTLRSRWGGRNFLIDSLPWTKLPCSLWVSHIASDTLLKHDLWITAHVQDTLSDSLKTWTYKVTWDLQGLVK